MKNLLETSTEHSGYLARTSANSECMNLWNFIIHVNAAASPTYEQSSMEFIDILQIRQQQQS